MDKGGEVHFNSLHRLDELLVIVGSLACACSESTESVRVFRLLRGSLPCGLGRLGERVLDICPTRNLPILVKRAIRIGGTLCVRFGLSNTSVETVLLSSART